MMQEHDRSELRSALLSIAAHHQGVLNPRDVVEAARDPENILHARFEWDDTVAGEAYRLEQAGALIRRIRIAVVRRAGEAQQVRVLTTRAYQSRPSMRKAKDGGYEAVEAIISEPEKRLELLQHVLRELQAYRQRYAELTELEAVWVAVDEALEDHRDSSSAAPEDEPRPGAAG